MFEIENGDTPFMDHSTVDTKVFFFYKKRETKTFFFQYGVRMRQRVWCSTGNNLMLKYASYSGHVGCGSGRILL